MSFVMGANEILRDYRTAKDKRTQLQILAELNDCSKAEIAEFLRARAGRLSARLLLAAWRT